MIGKVLALGSTINFRNWHDAHDLLREAIGESFDMPVNVGWEFKPTLCHYLGTEWDKFPLVDHLAIKLEKLGLE